MAETVVPPPVASAAAAPPPGGHAEAVRQPVSDAFRVVGAGAALLAEADTAHVVACGNSLISRRAVPGLLLVTESNGVSVLIRLTVAESVTIERPVQLCLGLFEPGGRQRVRLEVQLEAGARAVLHAHCLFNQPRGATQCMEASITLARGAQLQYREAHFHGLSGGIEARSSASVYLDAGARLAADFSLLAGRVGVLGVDYEVGVGTGAAVELTRRINGHGTDRIRVNDSVVLFGTESRSLIDARLTAVDDAVAELLAVTEGKAPGARGHVACRGTVADRGRVIVSPQAKLSHPLARITHAGAIGSVDHRRAGTSMSPVAPDSGSASGQYAASTRGDRS